MNEALLKYRYLISNIYGGFKIHKLWKCEKTKKETEIYWILFGVFFAASFKLWLKISQCKKRTDRSIYTIIYNRWWFPVPKISSFECDDKLDFFQRNIFSQ